MKKKTRAIIYWIVTILFSAFMLYSGISELVGSAQGDALFAALGYPLYLNYILGVAKVLGVFALLQPKFKTIKEWAYAGFTINLIGASASFIFIGAGFVAAIFPIIFLAIMFISYYFWKTMDRK